MGDSFFCQRCPNCGHAIAVRTDDQNRALQSVCTLLARELDWPRGSGHKLSAKAWLRLLIAAWERHHEREAECYPALDGEGFDIVYRRSSRLSTVEMAKLIVFAEGWAQREGG